MSIKELARRTGLSRNTVRAALRSDAPPVYRRAVKGSVLDPFKAEIHRLLKDDPKLPGVRVRELLEPLGCAAGKTVVDDYLREVRPLFAPTPRTFQRTIYRLAPALRGTRRRRLLLVPQCDSAVAQLRPARRAAHIRPREQRATDAGEAPRLLLPSESGGLDLRSGCSSKEQ